MFVILMCFFPNISLKISRIYFYLHQYFINSYQLNYYYEKNLFTGGMYVIFIEQL